MSEQKTVSVAVNKVNLLREQFEKEQAHAKTNFDKKIAEQVGLVKRDLATKLQEAGEIYKTLIAFTGSVWSEPGYEEALQTLRLTEITGTAKTKAKGKGQGSRKRVSEQEIIDTLKAMGITTSGGVAKELGIGKQTSVKKLDALASAGKIVRTKDGKAKSAPVTYRIK